MKRGVNLHPNHNLVKVDKKHNTAYFKNLNTGETVEQYYNLLHAVPVHTPPEFIKVSNLADAGGFLDIDRHTLQHLKYPNIFGTGDSTNLPISKTASAV